jgi:hypothetical protein
MLLALAIPWNDDIAQHVPTSLDAGGVMRVRQSNGWYSVEELAGDVWRRAFPLTMRRATMQRHVDLYTG